VYFRKTNNFLTRVTVKYMVDSFNSISGIKSVQHEEKRLLTSQRRLLLRIVVAQLDKKLPDLNAT
jgi:hypothetical protein